MVKYRGREKGKKLLQKIWSVLGKQDRERQGDETSDTGLSVCVGRCKRTWMTRIICDNNDRYC